MAEPLTSALSEDGTEILLSNAEKAETSEENAWRLSFNRISRFEREERSQQRGLHDCFSVLGASSGDGVAEYYQQQEEMLEGFTEMDTVAERGYLPGLSKEEREEVARSETIAIRLSNIANIILFTAKVYASIKSGSLAIIASTLDSLLAVVQYREFTEEGKPNTKLREIVEVPHIRPQPPDLNGQSFCINEVVDAYERDAWWKGVVKAIRPRRKKYVVYFQNTNEQREYNLKHLRVHQVWTDGNWVRASDTEDVGLNELNPSSPQLSSKNPVSIGLESARRSTRANKNRSKTRVSKISGECKVDEQCGNLQSAGSLPAKTVVNISSESARRSTRANKNQTETRASKLSGEYKADEQGGNLQAVGSLSTKNPGNTSLESARRFTRAYKNQSESETRVSQHSGECKVDEQCGNLKAAGSKSSKRKRESKQQSNSCKKKCPNEKGLEVTGAENEEKLRESVAVDNLQAVGSQLTSKSSKRKRESKEQSNCDNSCKKKCPNEKGLEVTGAEDEDKGLEVNEAEDEEKQRESVAVGPIGDLHENPGSPAEVETMTISMPYIEYVDQNLCSPHDTPVIRGRGTLKQIQLLAYHSVLEALYLQNNFDWKHEMLLTNLRDVFQISNEEHAKELKCVTSIQ